MSVLESVIATRNRHWFNKYHHPISTVGYEYPIGVILYEIHCILRRFLASERASKTIYPSASDVWTWTKRFPLEETKVRTHMHDISSAYHITAVQLMHLCTFFYCPNFN